MNRTTNETNIVRLVGEIASEFKISHRSKNTIFYSTEINVKRFSGYVDRIPLVVPERLIDLDHAYTGDHVIVTGHYCSYNSRIGDKTKLKLFVYAKSIETVESDSVAEDSNNKIILYGNICKRPISRKTLSDKDITDIMLAVNNNKRSDYIPCICWGAVANRAAEYSVGTYVMAEGRIQSREYVKKLGESKEETRVAYEVSISNLRQMNWTTDDLVRNLIKG